MKLTIILLNTIISLPINNKKSLLSDNSQSIVNDTPKSILSDSLPELDNLRIEQAEPEEKSLESEINENKFEEPEEDDDLVPMEDEDNTIKRIKKPHVWSPPSWSQYSKPRPHVRPHSHRPHESHGSHGYRPHSGFRPHGFGKRPHRMNANFETNYIHNTIDIE